MDDAGMRKRATIDRFKRAYESWNDVFYGKQKGVQFYAELFDFAKSTERNVLDFVENRRDESRRILASLERR